MKKFLTILCITIMLCSQGAVAFAFEDVDMEYESNNSMDSAQRISIKDGERQIIYGLVNEHDRNDWFRVVIDISHKTDLKVQFATYQSTNDLNLDVYIRDENGNFIKSSTNIGKEAREEFILENLQPNEEVYIHVDWDKGYLEEPYRIEIREY